MAAWFGDLVQTLKDGDLQGAVAKTQAGLNDVTEGLKERLKEGDAKQHICRRISREGLLGVRFDPRTRADVYCGSPDIAHRARCKNSTSIWPLGTSLYL